MRNAGSFRMSIACSIYLSISSIAGVWITSPAQADDSAQADDLAQAAVAASPKDVWITLGADAFETLEGRADISFEHHALKAVAERAEVVLTRVHEQDLGHISEILHESHRRCGGFIAHSTYEQAAEALAAAALPEIKALPKAFEINRGTVVRALKSKLGRDRIRNTIAALSTNFNNRFYRHASGRNASVYLRNLWRGYAASRPEVTVELYEHAGWLQPSVILTIPGTTLPDEVVVLGGHLDSITSGNSDPNFLSPGADDNASGIATLSEVIRATLANGFRPSRTVQFMGYAAEEVGLLGSQEIAQSYRNRGVDVVAVMQLDMTAFDGSVEDITLISDFTNSSLNQFVGRLVDTYQPNLSRSSSACGYACSDHASWTAAGFPATFPHEARFGEGNPNIHTRGDTLAFFGNNANHAFKFAHLAAAFMVETAFETVAPPAAPTELEVVSVSPRTVVLRWTDNATDETGFELERQVSDGSFERIAEVAADLDTYVVNDLETGTGHAFRVRAVNSGGASIYSNLANTMTLGERAPADLEAIAISATRATLSWTDRSVGESGFMIQARLSSDTEFADWVNVGPDVVSVIVDGLDPQSDYLFRVRAIGGDGDSNYSNQAAATTFIGDPEPCVADGTTLCLSGGRFKVSVTWRAGDTSGPAQVVPGGSSDSGLLWFFQADNWELLIKVLNGCPLNERFWVFAAATTDLEYDLVVTDSWTGYRSTYSNTAGTASPAVTDVDAFATCAAVEPLSLASTREAR